MPNWIITSHIYITHRISTYEDLNLNSIFKNTCTHCTRLKCIPKVFWAVDSVFKCTKYPLARRYIYNSILQNIQLNLFHHLKNLVGVSASMVYVRRFLYIKLDYYFYTYANCIGFWSNSVCERSAAASF